MPPEEKARQKIDTMLTASGWGRIYREVFGKGNDFCQKITYRTGFVRIVEKKPQPDGSELEEITWKRVSSLSPDEILSAFRNSYNPRITVTVDMIATVTAAN